MHQQADNTLYIEKVKREDAGTYVCQAQIKGRPITSDLIVSVVVNGQFLLHISKILNQIVARGLKDDL